MNLTVIQKIFLAIVLTGTMLNEPYYVFYYSLQKIILKNPIYAENICQGSLHILEMSRCFFSLIYYSKYLSTINSYLLMQITKISAGLSHSACIDGKSYLGNNISSFFQYALTKIFFLFVTVQKMVQYLYLENR